MPAIFGNGIGYIPMPKTTSTAISLALQAACPGMVRPHSGVLSEHTRACVARQFYPDATLIGSIVPPWKWVASFYHYMRRPQAKPWLKPYYNAVGTEEFHQVARVMTRPQIYGVDPETEYAVRETVEYGYSVYTWNYIRSYLKSEAIGLSISEIDKHYKDLCLIDYFVDGQQAVIGVPELIEHLGIGDPEAAREVLSKQINQSNWSHDLSDLYSPDNDGLQTATLMEAEEYWICLRHGFASRQVLWPDEYPPPPTWSRT